MAHAIMLQQPAPVRKGAEQRRYLVGKQGLGMLFEGNGGRFHAQRLRQVYTGLQQRLVTQMHPIEKAQGDYLFFLS